MESSHEITTNTDNYLKIRIMENTTSSAMYRTNADPPPSPLIRRQKIATRLHEPGRIPLFVCSEPLGSRALHVRRATGSNEVSGSSPPLPRFQAWFAFKSVQIERRVSKVAMRGRISIQTRGIKTLASKASRVSTQDPAAIQSATKKSSCEGPVSHHPHCA